MNRAAFVLFVLALLFSIPAAANDFVVDPASPVAGEPFRIILNVNCTAGTPVFLQNGFTIRVDFADSPGPCPEPPIDHAFTVNMPPLPGGGWEIRVDLPAEQPRLRRAFVRVRNRGENPFELHPSVIANDVASQEVRIRETLALADFCGVGGCRARIRGTEVEARYDGKVDAYVITVPHMEPGGFANVALVSNAGEMFFPDALYFFDRNAEPDLDVFERVLFPVLFNAPGANGSLWRTESVIVNPKNFNVSFFNEIDPAFGAAIGPKKRLELVGGNRRNGAVLLVPRREADLLAFASRVRDVSRVSEGFGTEVPVVRERDMFTGVLTLLDVPLDPQYRVKVRIYAYNDAGAGTVGTLAVHDAEHGALTEIAFLAVRHCGDAADCASTSGYAEIDLPTSTTGARANVHIRLAADVPAWAFATVTNNVTQQVTTVTADAGGDWP